MTSRPVFVGAYYRLVDLSTLRHEIIGSSSVLSTISPLIRLPVHLSDYQSIHSTISPSIRSSIYPIIHLSDQGRPSPKAMMHFPPVSDSPNPNICQNPWKIFRS